MTDLLDVNNYAEPAAPEKTAQPPEAATPEHSSFPSSHRYMVFGGDAYPEDIENEDESEDWEPLNGFESVFGVYINYSDAVDAAACTFREEHQWWQVVDLKALKIIMSSDSWSTQFH